jgi:hypothetical protein
VIGWSRPLAAGVASSAKTNFTSLCRVALTTLFMYLNRLW